METICKPRRRSGSPGRARTVACAAVALTLALVLAGCGQFSPIAPQAERDPAIPSAGNDPVDGSSTPVTPPPDSGAGAEIPTYYGFDIPRSDTSVVGNLGPAYGALVNGCADVKSFLSLTTEQTYWGFANPRQTVLYVAAVALKCGEDADTARELYDGIIRLHGTKGLARVPKIPLGHGEPECDLYRSLTSYFRDPASYDPHRLGAIDCFDPDAPDVFSAFLFVEGDDYCTMDETETDVEPQDSRCYAIADWALESVSIDPSPDDETGGSSSDDVVLESPAEQTDPTTPAEQTDPTTPADPAPSEG